MKFSLAAIAAILSTSALATPLEIEARDTVSMEAQVPNWTFQSVKRVCNSADTSCVWSFSINTHLAAPVPCTFTVKGAKADQTNSSGNVCGPFTVSSGWSGQFGPGNGFTTLAVVQNKKKLISYPAYTDKELAGGKVVTPNRSYPVQNLPS